MISSWMDDEGPLALTLKQWKLAQLQDPSCPRFAIFLLKFGKEWGYYDFPKFEVDLKKAILMAKLKHVGKQIVFIFDHSSVHKRKEVGGLDAKSMNLGPGGKQPFFHSTTFYNHTTNSNQEQTFQFPANHPQYPNLAKGAAQIAKERGWDVFKKKKEEVIQFLMTQEDFRNTKKQVDIVCEKSGIWVRFLPKFHCEFNPCELVWANSKRYCQAHNMDRRKKHSRVVLEHPFILISCHLPTHL
jgi:hypothetical protein